MSGQQKEKTASLSEARPPKFTALATYHDTVQQSTFYLRAYPIVLKGEGGARGHNIISKTMKIGLPTFNDYSYKKQACRLSLKT